MGRSLKLSVRCLSIVLPKWPIKRFQPVRQSRQQAPVLWHFAMDDPVRSYCPNIYTVIKGQKWKLHFPRILCWITRNDVSKAQVWLWNRSQFKLAKIRVCNAYLLVYIIIINFPTGSSMASAKVLWMFGGLTDGRVGWSIQSVLYFFSFKIY